MNQLNSVLLEGNLTRDPEAKVIPGGSPLCRFTLASNRYYKKENEKEHQQEVSYFDVEVWARTAENCERFLKKGSGVRVVGRLKQDRWNDDLGKGHSRIKIVGDQVEFIPSRNNGGQNKAQNERKEEVPVY